MIPAQMRIAEFGVRNGVQHFADLRFLPMAPRFCTLRMESGAKGTWQEVLPMSTVTGPIFSPISEFVVILVRADPNPFNPVFEPLSDRAVMIANADRESLPGTAL